MVPDRKRVGHPRSALLDLFFVAHRYTPLACISDIIHTDIRIRLCHSFRINADKVSKNIVNLSFLRLP